MKKNESTNVAHSTTNMLITYPGEKGIEVVTKNSVNIRKYLEENEVTKINVFSNTEKELQEYVKKYGKKNEKEKGR